MTLCYQPPLATSNIQIVDFYKEESEHLHIWWMVDGLMGAPLHCYTCAYGYQILEHWGKEAP